MIKTGSPQTFIIDSSSLINMRVNYPKDIFNPVWNSFNKLIMDEKVKICSEVYDEIKDDDLKELIKPHKKLIIKPSIIVQTKVKEILKEYSKLIDIKKMGSADPFIIAHASLNQWVVVTDEKGGSPKKIPYVCNQYSISHLNLVDFLRTTGFKL